MSAILAIISPLVPFISKWLLAWLDREIALGNQSVDIRNNFLKFVDAVNSSKMSGLRDSAHDQLNDFNKKP